MAPAGSAGENERDPLWGLRRDLRPALPESPGLYPGDPGHSPAPGRRDFREAELQPDPLQCSGFGGHFAYAKEEKLLVQATSYMFPPLRRDPGQVGRNDRFTPEEAAYIPRGSSR